MLLKNMISLKKSAVRSEIRYIYVLIKSYIYALKHLKEIKKENLKFFKEMV